MTANVDRLKMIRSFLLSFL